MEKEGLMTKGVGGERENGRVRRWEWMEIVSGGLGYEMERRREVGRG